MCVQFPKDYPQERLIVELKSKTIPEKFLDGLVSVCDQELTKHLGSTQVCSCIHDTSLVLEVVLALTFTSSASVSKVQVMPLLVSKSL